MLDRPRILLGAALALLLAACAGPARRVTPLAREEIPAPPPAAVELPKPQTKPPEEKPVIPPPVARPAQAPRIEPPRSTVPLTNWVSLKEWCASNHVAGPTTRVSATETNIEIRGERGTFTFEPPRRNARWNGLLVGVGFPLQFTNKQPYIHALDIAKVLGPLMLAEARSRTNGGIVIIDAGHGGENFGALSHDRKLKEKDLTLDWAKRVQKLLEGSQWKAILTREVDVDLQLTQRVAFAESKNADLFISLHFNSFAKTSEAGLETYCVTPQGMSSHLTRGYADEVNLAFANNHYDAENLLLAHDLHHSILKRTGRKDRGIRRARFMTVLREQNRPSVLLEGGYLSNPEEARLIATPAYRQKLAEAVAEALGVTPATLTTLRQ